MAKQFRYNDNLGNILNSSPEPIMGETKSIQTKYEGFEDYMNLDMSDYEIYSETSPDTPAKYTMISKPQTVQSPEKGAQNTKTTTKSESKGYQDYDDPPMIQVPDVIASKMFEQSKMSTINTVYIGSLTIVGLYVLFRYMKY
jgi:hypothetical protein